MTYDASAFLDEWLHRYANAWTFTVRAIRRIDPLPDMFGRAYLATFTKRANQSPTQSVI